LDELNYYRLDLALIQETTQQLIKDFGLFGIKIAFPADEKTTYEELKNQVAISIDEFLANTPHKLTSMLYAIDMGEEKVRKILEDPSSDRAQELSELIIRRELQKVITRKIFSKPKSGTESDK
jgi:hypothetical protein